MAKSRAPTNWVFSIAFSLSIFSRIARRCRMASRLFIVVSLLMESAVIGLTDTGLLSEQFPLNILCPSTDCLRRPLVVHSASAGARVTIWTGTLEGKRTRLNSSHGYISYAVFCLKKKKLRSEEQTYEFQSQLHVVYRIPLRKNCDLY